MQIKFLPIATAVIVFAVPTTGWSNPYCQRFADQMEPKSLYAATCLRGPECLERVVTGVDGTAQLQGSSDPHRLEPGRRYQLIFKSDTIGMANSLVVIQLKRSVYGTPATTPPKVKIKRYGLNFACVKRNWGAARLSDWPPNGRHDEISFDAYDRFHRYGIPRGDDGRRLERLNGFHVLYNNGETCVSTQDPIRRRQFLLEDRDNVPNVFSALLTQLFGAFDTTPSVAQSAQKYTRLRVLVSNYQRKPTEAGCLGFPVTVKDKTTASLEVHLRDVERQVQAFPSDTSQTWLFKWPM